MTTTRFEFDEVGTAATGGRLLGSYLAEILDTFTTRRLTQAGVAEGSRCLVIGADAGSIAGWLADRAGSDGEVVVADTDPSHVPAYPGVTALRHDPATDPLVEDDFDLVYVRSVMACLPGRRGLLARLATALSPGGVIVLDELEAGFGPGILYAPDPDAHRLFARYQQALDTVLRRAGIHPWSYPTHRVMREAGLVGVDTECWSRSWRGGEPGCLLPRALAAQLFDDLTEAGIARPDLAAFRGILLDSRLVVRGCPVVSTIGRKPATATDGWFAAVPVGAPAAAGTSPAAAGSVAGVSPVPDRLSRCASPSRGSPIFGRIGPHPSRP
ncbi:MAG: SAM-dependent methyltransferase [Micromonosporaceae bacterium]|nr:SAM-dependent methyltransferase [Micromonosporaceae bacterium]